MKTLRMIFIESHSSQGCLGEGELLPDDVLAHVLSELLAPRGDPAIPARLCAVTRHLRLRDGGQGWMGDVSPGARKSPSERSKASEATVLMLENVNFHQITISLYCTWNRRRGCSRLRTERYLSKP